MHLVNKTGFTLRADESATTGVLQPFPGLSVRSTASSAPPVTELSMLWRSVLPNREGQAQHLAQQQCPTALRPGQRQLVRPRRQVPQRRRVPHWSAQQLDQQRKRHRPATTTRRTLPRLREQGLSDTAYDACPLDPELCSATSIDLTRQTHNNRVATKLGKHLQKHLCSRCSGPFKGRLDAASTLRGWHEALNLDLT